MTIKGEKLKLLTVWSILDLLEFVRILMKTYYYYYYYYLGAGADE
jgi:hypothetical protein